MNYGFLQDINGDKCQKTLIGMIIGVVWLVLSITVVVYGLSNEVKSQNIVIDTLWAMATISGVMLGLTTFQKQRIGGGDNGNT